MNDAEVEAESDNVEKAESGNVEGGDKVLEDSSWLRDPNEESNYGVCEDTLGRDELVDVEVEGECGVENECNEGLCEGNVEVHMVSNEDVCGTIHVDLHGSKCLVESWSVVLDKIQF